MTYPESNYTSELYHLSEDPKELYNLIDQDNYKKVAKKLDKALNKFLKNINYQPPKRIRGKGKSIEEIYQN